MATTAKKNIPALRFPQFMGEWEEKRLGDVVTIRSGNSPDKYNLDITGIHPYLKVEDLNNNDKYQMSSRQYSDSSEKLIDVQSIIFPKRGAAIMTNKVRINEVPVLLDSNLMAIKPSSNIIYSEFLYYWIWNKKLYEIADTSTIPQINNKHISPLLIQLPDSKEQTKIALSLSSIDERLQQLQQQQSLLEQYKNGCMQQLFSQKLRFKNDKGKAYPEWKEVPGGDAFENISNKKHNSDLPILAITQEFGAIPRDLIDYNVLVSEKSVESYKVVEVGDFIISLRSFQGGIEYSNYKGICSPAYIILRPSVEVDRGFFKYYFKTSTYIKRLTKKLEGIRDGKMISYGYFSEVLLPLPSVEEQTKIANFLSAIDEQINTVKQQIAQTQQFKKGLLQQMFV